MAILMNTGGKGKMTERRMVVPVAAMRQDVIFPNTDPLLSFGRSRSVKAVKEAAGGNKLLVLVAQKERQIEDPGFEDMYEVGTLVRLEQVVMNGDDMHALAKGLFRVKIRQVMYEQPYLSAEVEELAEVPTSEEDDKVKALVRYLKDQIRRVFNLGKQGVDAMQVMRILKEKMTVGELADQLSSFLDIKVVEKQELLEMVDVKKRLEKLVGYLSHEANVLDLEQSITAKTQERFEKQMKEAMLKEKKRMIEEELGEATDDDKNEAIEFKKKISKAGMPADVRQKAEKELLRFTRMSPHNPERGYLSNYLEWLAELPWGKLTPNDTSIVKAAKILDEDHYGLKDAKERIVEFLAVMKLKAEGKRKGKKNDKLVKDGEASPTILCFVGPPGVGKTSIGRSIARALGRRFVRVSLGGVRDEAEIRGHRRTYVGAMPGRIIQGIRNAGTRNPVFMLDEVDKIGQDFRGDPSAALLEALDPEQNREFSDHYLEVPFNLSQVMFICTANMLETIPPALLDRMEVIEFAGYTEDEKLHIAKNFLWKKQVRANGLEGRGLRMIDGAMIKTIERYTREAGVRNLERNLATICRKVARQMAEGKKAGKVLGEGGVRKYLGPERFSSLLLEKKDRVGMATGMAVTPAGGEIIFVEALVTPGKGKLTLTGQLGDVMKESAKAAFSWTRAHWQDLGLRRDFGDRIDMHIHVPAGAVPKDGPSAGVTIVSALVSALTGLPARRDVAMTGEISLRGRVMEIGGVKSKVIAAHRAGVRQVILPKENEKDLEKIPEQVKKELSFVFASELPEVLSVVFGKKLVREAGVLPMPLSYIAAASTN